MDTKHPLTPLPTAKTIAPNRHYLRIIVMLGLLLATLFGTQYFFSQKADQEVVLPLPPNSDKTKADVIADTVQSVIETVEFPVISNEVMFWTGISGTDTALRYHYLIHSTDVTLLTNLYLKNMLLESVCYTEEILDLLANDINLEYSYTVENSERTFFVEINKADCF